MKKIYSFFVVILIGIQATFAGAGCTIDTTNQQFFSPSADSIPCVERGVPYNQVLQIHVPKTIDVGPSFGLPAGLVIINVDSLQIDSITGFPNGLNYSLNPGDGYFKGGDNGCALAYGTTTAPTGHYPLKVYGTISVSNIPALSGLPPDTTFSLQDAPGGAASMFTLGLDVINTGEPCHPQVAGINNFNSALNSIIQVYPNPSNGVFELSLNTGGRVNGEVVVTNVDGQKVYSQAIDAMGLFTTGIDVSKFAKGLYTLQIRTTEGFASQNIVIQ